MWYYVSDTNFYIKLHNEWFNQPQHKRYVMIMKWKVEFLYQEDQTIMHETFYHNHLLTSLETMLVSGTRIRPDALSLDPVQSQDSLLV